jgi:hypothetical protein
MSDETDYLIKMFGVGNEPLEDEELDDDELEDY